MRTGGSGRSWEWAPPLHICFARYAEAATAHAAGGPPGPGHRSPAPQVKPLGDPEWLSWKHKHLLYSSPPSCCLIGCYGTPAACLLVTAGPHSCMCMS